VAEVSKDLRARWKSLSVFDLRRLLEEEDSPFGLTPQGYEDFRGVELSKALNKMRLEKVDFSYATLGRGQLGGASQFIDCRFFAMVYDGTAAGEFLRSDFTRSDLSHAVLMGSFLECSFDAAKCVDVRASKVRFEGCKFTGANLRKASFYDCRFVRCAFDHSAWSSGAIANCRFDTCTFEGVDLRRTTVVRSVGLSSVA
jgi:uncharacterized protein YjbI with pentapeptide repeats